jgi:spermidine/putrescine transport system permease protein
VSTVEGRDLDQPGRRLAGLGLATVGGLMVLASVFLPMADTDAPVELSDNSLIQSGAAGWILIVAAVAMVALGLQTYRSQSESLGRKLSGALTLVSLAALVTVVIAGTAMNLEGTTSDGVTMGVDGSAAVGIYLAAIGAILGSAGGVMLGASSWLRRNGITIVGAFGIVFLLIPIAVIIFFSFNNPAGKYNFTWVGFTLEHWKNAFGLTDLNDALKTSLELAALATLISTVLGTLIALALVRHEFFGRKTANVLIVIPMATPEIIMGASLLSFFLILNTFTLGFQTLLIAHVMFCISFVVVVVRSRLIGFDRSLEEAARDLGADAFTTFRKVTLPLLLPGIVGAAMLAFALSIDDFVVSNFNSGTTVTFPLYIFGAAQRGIPVEVNVIATMLFAVTIGAMLFTAWQARRAERLASVRPEQEEEPFAPSRAMPPAPSAAGG